MTSPYSAPGAPWTLTGRGWVILFAAPKEWLRSVAPPFMDGESAGGVGSLMFVDYQTSPVGPYQEVLLIPGRYRPAVDGGANGSADAQNRRRVPRRGSITSIYVSSSESVVGGRVNWGLPKELAQFRIQRTEGFWSVDESIVAERDGQLLAVAELSARGPRFPVSTLFHPFPLFQVRDGRHFWTDFRGSGWGRLGTVRSLRLTDRYIPDMSWVRPRLVVRVDPFRITFPSAHVSPGR